MYLACIFDLDGTLVNTLKSIAYFSNEALRQCGHPAIPTEQYKAIVGDGADMQVRRMLNLVLGENSFSESEFQKVRNIYGGLYAADPTRLAENYAGMPETIQSLKKKGLKTAVLSNKPHGWVTAIIGSLFPAGSFDLVYGQRPQVPRKPSPEGALLIAQELHVLPADCLYIGDTNTDMKTGKAAGMDTAGVLWGFRTKQELEQNGAVYLAEKPQDLCRLTAADCKR